MWATAVRLTISQVSVVPSSGKASARAGLKVLPLISQVGLKTPPIVISQVRSGFGEACLGPRGQRPQLRGTRVRSGSRREPTRNCIRAPT